MIATVQERLRKTEWRRRCVRATDILLEGMWRLPVLGARFVSAERVLVPANPCRVLFLCKGNICRSVFAELVAHRLAGGRSGWEFRSAGLEAGTGTVSPDGAVRVGKEFGVDLESHRSRSVDPEDFSASDVVFVMEPRQRSDVLELAGLTRPTVVLLGAFCRQGEHRPVIRDPFGQEEAAYRRAFEQIQDAVTTVLACDDRTGRGL